ncbi:MAG: BACON domain-containing protein [Alistipes sp.]|nr:BACON domain-containing protein [Alistipes sp.]
MKKILMMCVVVLAIASCNKISDTPKVEFEKSSYTISAEEGKYIIPVNSTGVDEVSLEYDDYTDRWEVDNATGNLYPKEGWIELIRVISNYETRDLASWRSGIEIEVEENEGYFERKAYITVRSFTASKRVAVIQPARDALIVKRGGAVVYTDSEAKWRFEPSLATVTPALYDLYMDGTRFVEQMPLLDMEVTGMVNQHSNPKQHFLYAADAVVPSIKGNPMPNYTLTNFRCEMESWAVMKVSFECMGCNVSYVKYLGYQKY